MLRFLKITYITFLFFAASLFGEQTDERLNAGLLYKTGLKSFSEGNFAASSKYFSEFASRYSEEEIMQKIMPKVYYVLGCSYYNLRKMEEAVTAFDKYIAFAPEGKFVEDVLFRKANALRFLQKYEKAISVYKKLLTKFPKSKNKEEILFQTAVCYLAGDKFKEAAPILKNIVDKNQKGIVTDTSAAYLLRCYNLTGNYDEALNLLKKISKQISLF